ncbi:MAG: hypothetical protein OEZ29_00720 [Candidatus Bathyarchaeota archaeon]|nr:hypothetical protein [Candidatus Bathyarchaeota archaeon]
MPKAGKYDFPYFDLDLALKKLLRIHEVLREDEIDRSVVAETLGMAERGGGFLYLISSMDKYGLVKTGGGRIIITQLGKFALYGEETEKKRARHNAILKVDLFKELYEQFGKDATNEQIRAFLRQKAFVEVDKAQKIADHVYRIYKKAAKHLLPAKTPSQPPISEVEGEGRRETMKPLESQALKIQYKNVLIQIPRDDVEAIEFVEKALAYMKKEILEERQKTTETKAD